ncbi:MAG: hypothetical protein ACRET7_14915 [Burkholderiales bacterium]
MTQNQNQIEPLADQGRYRQGLALKKANDDLVLRKWQVAKRFTWMILLAGAFLVFYLMDKLNEALSILR